MWYHMIFATTISLLFTGYIEGATIKRQSGPEPKTCETEGCKTAAERVKTSLNTSVDPCEDFYEFGCGGWIQNNPVPASGWYTTVWSRLASDVAAEIEDLINKPITAEDLDAVKKLKTLYASCMDEETQNKFGAKPMLELLDTIGGWPLLKEDWSEEEKNFDLVDLLVKIRRYNSKVVFRTEIQIDVLSPVSRIIKIDQPPLGMGRSSFVGSGAEKAVPAFKKFAHDVAMALGSNNSMLNEDITDLTDFAVKVAGLTATPTERRYVNDVYNKLTIKELSSNISKKFDWMRYIGGMMSESDLADEVDENEPIMLLSKNYTINVLELIAVTPKKTVANYVVWIFVKLYATQLSVEFRKLELEFKQAFQTVTGLSPRNKVCNNIFSHMGDLKGRMFVDKYFNESSKVTALGMVNRIRTEFKDMLTEIDWMDNQTREVSREKAEAIHQLIGYSDKILDNDYLNKTYATLEYQPDKYFENMMDSAVFSSIANLNSLRDLVDRTAWTTAATTVNCFYSPLRNVMQFPAGILQPPYFSHEYPKSMNFGGIGAIMAHEITHGFDDKGRKFDKDGNYVQWWSDEVIKNFENRTQCITDQYGGYFVPEANMTINGVLTLTENIADNGGIRQAYLAYQKWQTEVAEDDPVLPELEYNRQQLFFISFAQVMCENEKPEITAYKMPWSKYSPSKYRVNGVLRNFPAFSEVFNCPQSSYMNAEHRCRVW